MQKAEQDTPEEITIPDAETRILRAKLILEEAFETIHAMGVKVMDMYDWEYQNTPDDFDYVATDDVDLIEVADGCADIKVVTTGTLIAFGIKDKNLQNEVDESNLRKFAEGGYRSDGTDGNPEGKWIKPKDWKKPNIAEAIGYND